MINYMKYILGKKLGMTQIFTDNGKVIPVTCVLAGPCQITQIQKGKLQLGYSKTPEFRLKKPQVGHLKGLEMVKILREVRVEKAKDFKRGDLIDIETFVKGDKVAVTGVSKGKGFQGVVKRHGFKGTKASHGNKDQLRASGSIGATGPQKVFKGMRMAGRMGGEQTTVQNLEVMDINLETQEIYLKGALPGARNGLLLIAGVGDIKIKEDKKVEETKVEEVKEVVEEKVETPVVEKKAEVKTEEKKAEKVVEKTNTDEKAVDESKKETK